MRIQPRSLKNMNNQLQNLVRGRLWLKILIAMGLGLGTGILLGPSVGFVPKDTSEVIGNWLALPGQLFLGLIQMVVVPLVFASVIRGLASGEDMEQLRKLGTRLIIYFIVTTIIAISIGIIIALVIQPGQFIDQSLTNFYVKPAEFLVPLGATINMDGTALYQGVATVFLAQVFDVQLTLASLLLVIVTAVGASIGSPATPGVGIVILSMVLSSVGISSGGIALIIGVVRILDMSRTAINVTGDLTASMVMDKLVGGEKPVEI